MGVTHSMEENQVKRISTALNRSAEAIQGINTKFDLIDEHVQKMLDFNRTTNSKVHRVLSSFERLDDTFNDRAEKLLESLVGPKRPTLWRCAAFSERFPMDVEPFEGFSAVGRCHEHLDGRARGCGREFGQGEHPAGAG